MVRFLKILFSVFIISVLAMIVGRDHFLFGTALVICRWIFFVTGLVFFWIASRRITPKYLKIGLVGASCLLLVEFAWNKLQEKELKSSPSFNKEISLMTYNIFFRNFDLNASIDNIKKNDPDILTLQELTPTQKAELDNTIGSKYPFKKTMALRGTHGIGIYSKYPITHSELLMNDSNLPFAQLIELSIDDKKIQVINVHLASPAVAVENPEYFFSLYNENYFIRSQQLQRINQAVNEKDNKYSVQLLMGDLNTTSFEPIYRDMKKDWVNFYDLAGDGWGLSFPHSARIAPVITLDYIFGNGVVQVIEMKVVEGGGSDHLAIAGKIKI